MKSNAYSSDGTTSETTNKITNIQQGVFSNGSTNLDTEFADPLGYNYVFALSSTRNETWNWSSAPQTAGSAPDTAKGFVIHIYGSSHCSGETVETDNSNRVVAYKYRLESSGYYCGDNN